MAPRSHQQALKGEAGDTYVASDCRARFSGKRSGRFRPVLLTNAQDGRTLPFGDAESAPFALYPEFSRNKNLQIQLARKQAISIGIWKFVVIGSGTMGVKYVLPPA